MVNGQIDADSQVLQMSSRLSWPNAKQPDNDADRLSVIQKRRHVCVFRFTMWSAPSNSTNHYVCLSLRLHNKKISENCQRCRFIHLPRNVVKRGICYDNVWVSVRPSVRDTFESRLNDSIAYIEIFFHVRSSDISRFLSPPNCVVPNLGVYPERMSYAELYPLSTCKIWLNTPRYLGNRARWNASNCRSLIASSIRAFHWCQNRLP